MPLPAKKKRLDCVRNLLRDADYDAFLINSISNIRYITGFSGSCSHVLLTESCVHLFVDSRYTERAYNEAVRGVDIVGFEGQAKEAIAGFLLKKGCARVAFESSHMTHGEWKGFTEKAPAIEFIPAENCVEKLRAVKDNTEIRLIRQAVSVLKDAFMHVSGLLANKPSITEKELSSAVKIYFFRQDGAESAFEPIIAGGPRASAPHAAAGDLSCFSREEQSGALLVDIGVRTGSYCADATRMFTRKKQDPLYRRIVSVVDGARMKALDAVRPGIPASEIDRVARDYIDATEFKGAFIHGLGHGIGLDVHELPRVTRYNTEEILQENMVFTVEPGIYLPGKWGVRIEDMVRVTSSGAELLTAEFGEISLVID